MVTAATIPFRSESIQIGSVTEVSGYRIACEQPQSPLDGPASHAAAQIGTVVKIMTPTTFAFGFVDSIAFQSSAGEARRSARTEIDLLGEVARVGDSAAGVFVRGISIYPILGAAAFIASDDDMALIYGKPSTATLAVGTLHRFPERIAHLKSEAFFTKHSVIVGTTGAGKSCALALILRALLKAHPHGHILLLDPHGEYGPAFPDLAESITPGTLELPYWLFGFDEIVEVICSKEPIARSREALILKDAIIQAKRDFLETIGSPPEITVDTPTPYLMSELVRYVSDEMGRLLKADTSQPYLRLISTIEGLAADRRYQFMFDQAHVHKDMVDILGRLLRIPVDGRPITVLDISAVPSEITNVVVSLVCRLVFDFATNCNRDEVIPIMIACDEAHRYIPRDDMAGFETTRRAIGRIAKEGRKYGLSLCLVTQRPSELSETVLSQCGTVIALRMPNKDDQRYVRSHLPDAYGGLLNMLPTLGEQEAILVGEGALHPMRIRFNDLEPDHQPRVAPTNFPAAWDKDVSGKKYLAKLLGRWRGW
jgi:DNA helicase HerA-like ATPase